MNYLAHGYRFLNSPPKLAGTAVPDWLSVVDRKVRVRRRHVHEQLETLQDNDRCIADGVLQHLDDDDLFHRCPRFMMLEYELSETTRQKMAANPADVKAAIATIANQVFDHKGPVEGIGKYQGGVRVNNREIVMRASNVMDDRRRSVDTTPEENALSSMRLPMSPCW